MTTIFRLSVLLALLGLAVLVRSGSAIAGASGKLTVLDWPGYEDKDYWRDFINKYPDVKVSVETRPDDAAIYDDIKAGYPADVIHPYTSYLQFYIDGGLVEEIDVKQLANWDKIPDILKAIGRCGPTDAKFSHLELHCPPALKGKQYFIPWDWGFSSILYRTDQVDKAKGKPTHIESWKALFDKDYEHRISMYSDGPSAVSVSSYINGYKETDIKPPQLEKIKDEWIGQQKQNKNWENEDDLVDAMDTGNVWVAYAWQSAYAKLITKGKPVAYADPIEGRASWVGVYGIRKGTKNYDYALRFVDEKLSTETATNVVDKLYYGVANQEVMSKVSDPTIKQVLLTADPSVLERTQFTPQLTDWQRKAYKKMWTDVKAAAGR